jgi:1,4-dihydroxy-2-naphthoate octaprenyltransferase
MAALSLSLLFVVAAPPPGATIATCLGLSFLALSYTVPPLKLSHRGLGELDVALTHSLGAVLAGYVIQSGAIPPLLPFWVSLPMFFSILPSIIMSGIPDFDADRQAGKKTLVVHLGVRRSTVLAAALAVLAACLGTALPLLGVAALSGLEFVALPHAAILLWLVARRWHDLDRAIRIDGMMGAALLYIGWFVVIPVINLS